MSSRPGTRTLRIGRARAAGRRGFTLIETALTTVIIGVGVLALIEAQQSFMKTNDWSTRSATATYLANEIREMTRKFPRHDDVTGLYIDGGTLRGWGPEAGELVVTDFDDLDDFDGLTFRFNGTPGMTDGDLPGPVDGFGAVIPNISAEGQILLDADGAVVPLDGWSQEVRVEKVDPDNPSVVYADNAAIAGVGVDRFPLRVTVTVRHRRPFETAEETIAQITWIAP